ncbi:MAG TPA: SBBP repeat-containing protein, partial [candidate division Zixibacteria bacterium]|nr:SBBP repeat-containing protein [candidate division Zixibacteria bacterium]
GDIIEQPLFVYQDIDGSRVKLQGQYVVKEGKCFSFAVEEYDPEYALVIDPLLIYSSYLGGSSVDEILGIAVNSAGEAIVSGYTQSANFPMVNAYQSTIVFFDAFVTKFASSGSSLIFSTYLGGTGDDLGYVADVDGSGAIYIAGQTASTDFPTLNEYQTEQGGYDNFVTKMSSAGNSLSYSTYIGGISDEGAIAIAVDTAGAAYVTGYTSSTNYPTVNSYQTDQTDLDAFVTKVSASGNSLAYSTYLGHSGIDQGNGIAVDAAGSAYVVGQTTSTAFPTVNAYQTDQPQVDAFATKFSSAGSSLVYSTYLGGSGGEQAYGAFVDNAGVAYICGNTTSTNFPTLTPYQTDQPITDAFVLKLSSLGTNLFFSTYLGGDGNDAAYGIAVDALGYVTVAGSTGSTNFPTQSSYQGDAGTTDVFVTKFIPAGTSLVFSTYLGGDSLDVARGVALDGIGAAYVSGNTKSPNFPTLNPYQTDQGIEDVFVAKLRLCCILNRGDCNNDGTDANILDLNFLVNRIFRGGASAVCPEEADVNSDGTPQNILDLNYLVNRIFRGGPAPGAC